MLARQSGLGATSSVTSPKHQSRVPSARLPMFHMALSVGSSPMLITDRDQPDCC